MESIQWQAARTKLFALESQFLFDKINNENYLSLKVQLFKLENYIRVITLIWTRSPASFAFILIMVLELFYSEL